MILLHGFWCLADGTCKLTLLYHGSNITFTLAVAWENDWPGMIQWWVDVPLVPTSDYVPVYCWKKNVLSLLNLWRFWRTLFLMWNSLQRGIFFCFLFHICFLNKFFLQRSKQRMKGWDSSPQNDRVLTVMWFQNCMRFFLLRNTNGDILKKVDN